MRANSLRPITVDGLRFRWRFDGSLVVIPEGRSGPQLRVEWGWRDHVEPDGPGGEPQVVTPSFVAAAIHVALSAGWRPSDAGSPFSVNYRDGRILVARRDAGSGGAANPGRVDRDGIR